MYHFCNVPENFFRKIKKVFFYKASTISYINNLSGIFPSENLAIASFDLNPSSFNHKIGTKTQNNNYFYELDSNFPLFDLNTTVLDFCFTNFNKEDFAVVFVSDRDRMMFGNEREKVKIEFIDNKKLNNSGTDEFTIIISGKSILIPKLQAI